MRKRFEIFGLMTFLFMSLFVLSSCKKKNSSSTNATKVGVSKLLAHPSLDAVEKGAKDYLDSTGLSIDWDVQNANGDISTTAGIAAKFKDDKKDIVLGIATPSAQSLATLFPASSNVPVLFAAVTDPVDAGLVSSWEKSTNNVCGVSDMTPVEDQIKLLVQLTGARTIGTIYASGEANSVVQKNLAEEACKKLGVSFISASVANSAEVRQATQSIVDRVDAIYIATDNVVKSALSSVNDVAYKAGKPILAADPVETDDLNLLIAWGFDYYSIGVETGKMIEKLIKGQKPSELGTVILSDPAASELHINLDTAKRYNISISDDLLKSATVTIEDGKVNKNK